MGAGMLLLVAGCTAASAGQAQPVSSAGGASQTSSSPGSSSAAATSLPPRPAELSVAGVDPCALLPESQRSSLEIDRPPLRPSIGPDPVVGGAICTFSVAAWGVYGVDVSPTFTVAAWTERTQSKAEDNRVTAIGGYPAVVTYTSKESGGCIVVVDIASDSVLAVTITDRRDDVVQDGKVVCANAEKAAGVALTTLQAMQK